MKGVIIFGEWKGVDDMKEFIAKIRQRYNPAEKWMSVNPVLDAGEIGIESDTGFFKFGDGVTLWRDLGYAMTHATVEVDKTLTEDGEAADALITGDRLRTLEYDVGKMKYEDAGGLNLDFKIAGLKKKKENEAFDEGRIQAEIGEVFEQIKLVWSMGLEPQKIIFVYPDDNTEEREVKKYSADEVIYDTSISGNSTWRLKVTNPFGVEENFSTSLKFYRYLYYGSYASEADINAELIHSKSKKPLTNGKSVSFSITVPAGEQPFVALPSTLGRPEVSIKEGVSTASVTASMAAQFLFPTIYSEKDKTNYTIWEFSNPPSQEEKWQITLG